MAHPRKGRTYWEPGDWDAVCSMCGAKRKASELVKNWKGQWRCPHHNEQREAQDFVRGKIEHPVPPWIQPPPPTDSYAGVCTPNGRTAYAGNAVAGCVYTSYLDPMYDVKVTS